MRFSLRPARKSDAAALAVLTDMAGHGLPSWFWHPARGQDGFVSVVEVGRDRILQDDHPLSYKKMIVTDVEGTVAGILLDYAIDDPKNEAAIAKEHRVLQPILRLEAQVPASWYINMLAVFREYRGLGIGAALIEESVNRAKAAGKTVLSLIAEDDNPTLGLYRRCGFEIATEEKFEDFSGSVKQDGNWVLMVRNV